MPATDFFEDMRVVVVDPRDDSLGWSALIYSLAGGGKTSLAASASKVEALSPVLYIDLERGIMPAIEHGDLDNMTVIQPETFIDFKNIIMRIDTAREEFPFKTIVIDTIDRLQERIIDHWESDTNTYAKWAASYEQVARTIDALSNLNINVICLTHENREVLENIGSLMIAPSFEGKKSGIKLPSVFDIVGRLTWEEVGEDLVPVLTTKTEDNIVVKTRFSNMPAQLGNPTFTKIHKYITEYKNAIKEGK